MSTEVNGDRGSVTPTPQQQLSANGNGVSKPVPGARRKIKVEITSDAICPFCILGLRYLQQAIATAQSSDPSSPLAHLDFELEFKPFLLDPTLSREPLDKREKYEARFGKEKFAKMEKMMQERASKVGINLVYDGPVSSTHDYHRVLHAAYAKGGQDLQLPLAERLFSGYFEHQRDPGSRAWLAQEAVASGVFSSVDEANQFFQSDTYDAEVKQGYLAARKLGIAGVPFFVFEGKWAVSGAQPPEAFLDIFQELVKCGCGRTNGAEKEQQKASSDAQNGDRPAGLQAGQNGNGATCGDENAMVCG